jgi:predicted HTH domain antitoxin
LEEAIALFLADACSLGRAVELAGVTRWDIIDYLKERDIPIFVHSSRSAQEIDDLALELEREGILRSSSVTQIYSNRRSSRMIWIGVQRIRLHE